MVSLTLFRALLSTFCYLSVFLWLISERLSVQSIASGLTPKISSPSDLILPEDTIVLQMGNCKRILVSFWRLRLDMYLMKESRLKIQFPRLFMVRIAINNMKIMFFYYFLNAKISKCVGKALTYTLEQRLFVKMLTLS